MRLFLDIKTLNYRADSFVFFVQRGQDGSKQECEMTRNYGFLILMIIFSDLFIKAVGLSRLFFPNSAWQPLLLVPGVFLLGCIALWTVRDAKKMQNPNPVLWGVLVLVTFLPGLLLYFVLNRSEWKKG